jgi:hypothetical protein
MSRDARFPELRAIRFAAVRSVSEEPASVNAVFAFVKGFGVNLEDTSF